MAFEYENVSEDQMRTTVSNYCVGKGIVTPDGVEEEISKMAALYPSATAEAAGLSDLQRAYAVCMRQNADNTPAPTSTVPTAPATPVASVTNEERAAVKQKTLALVQQSKAIRDVAEIKGYLLARPDPAMQKTAKTTGVIDTKSWQKIQDKITKGEYQVMDSYEDPRTKTTVPSKANYEALCAAVAGGTEVEVHFPTWATRPIGYMVDLPAASTEASGTLQTTDLSRKEMLDYLTFKAGGYLGQQSTEQTAHAAVRLRMTKERASTKEVGKTIPAQPVLTDINRKEFAKDPTHLIPVRTVSETTEVKKMKSELVFKVIDTTKPLNKKGERPAKAIRATVSATVKALVLIPDYKEKYDTARSSANVAPTTPEEINKVADIVAKAQIFKATQAQGALDELSLNPIYSEDVAKLRQLVSGGATAPNANVDI